MISAWFIPQIDYKEMAEKIELNEEYAIHDYEAPFEISEYTSISEIKDTPLYLLTFVKECYLL